MDVSSLSSAFQFLKGSSRIADGVGRGAGTAIFSGEFLVPFPAKWDRNEKPSRTLLKERGCMLIVIVTVARKQAGGCWLSRAYERKSE